jgi:hypothetical protein
LWSAYIISRAALFTFFHKKNAIKVELQHRVELFGKQGRVTRLKIDADYLRDVRHEEAKKSDDTLLAVSWYALLCRPGPSPPSGTTRIAPTHGYAASREEAMAAFAKSWRRE